MIIFSFLRKFVCNRHKLGLELVVGRVGIGLLELIKRNVSLRSLFRVVINKQRADLGRADGTDIVGKCLFEFMVGRSKKSFIGLGAVFGKRLTADEVVGKNRAYDVGY